MIETTTGSIYSFNLIDYTVMIAYLTMLISVGFIMKKLCSNTKDYFIGGNRVSWQLAGTSCFMGSFSAWTFTGAAGFAYKYGILIMVLFFSNVIAYTFAGFFLAAKCRQTRRMTGLQIVYDRFGRITEQFYTWMQVPMMLFVGAIWLTGLATFVSVGFGWPMEVTIILSGTVVILFSTLAGSWGVLTTDFLQGLILVSLTIVIAGLVLIKTGGMFELVNKIEPAKLKFFSDTHSKFWVFAYFFQAFFMFCSITGFPKYLAVRDGKSASKAAFLGASLFMVGLFVWFIPPIAASYYFPNIAQMLPGFTHPQDAAYVLMGLTILPHGLAALLIMVVFSATLSCMDHSMNQNAAILCMNIYKPLLRPKAGEREMFVVAHIFNVILGLTVVSISLAFARQKELALFDLMLLLSGSIGLPIVIPLFLVYWVKNAPKWAALPSAIAGVILSVLSKNYGFLEKPHRGVTELLNTTGLFNLDSSVEWPFALQVGGIILLGGGVFMFSTLFWRWTSKDQKKAVGQFYERMNRPVDVLEENIRPQDLRQFAITGRLAMVAGMGILLLALPSATMIQRLACVITGTLIGVAGIFMYKLGRKDAAKITPVADEVQPAGTSEK